LGRTTTDTDVVPSAHRQIRRPSLRLATKSLYMQAPPQLEVATRPNLERSLSELLESGDVVTVTDSSLPFSLDLIVKLE
jgi:ubiquitin-activating enzyme E1 C